MASGGIDGGSVNPGEMSGFDFSAEVDWVPSGEAALGLITPGKTYVSVSGSVYVADRRAPLRQAKAS